MTHGVGGGGGGVGAWKVALGEGTLCNRTGSYRCYLEGRGEEVGLGVLVGGWLGFC